MKTTRKFDVLAAILFFSVAWYVGSKSYHQFNLSYDSENQVVSDAVSIIAGNASYGLISYTHYPNGPAYVLIPFLAAGMPMDWDVLRIIPLTFSALSFAAFVFVLLWKSSEWTLKLWVLVISGVLLSTPAYYAWQGALHQFSYAVALIFLTVAMGMVTRQNPWVVFLLGFVSGWTGYDFLPAQFFSYLTVRFLLHTSSRERKLVTILAATIQDGLFLAGGLCAAIGGHLIQNALFYGGFAAGLSDLIGSAVLRMGLGNAAEYAWQYPQQSSFFQSYNPTYISRVMLDIFLWGVQSPWGSGPLYDGYARWSNGVLMITGAAAAFSLAIYQCAVRVVRGVSSWGVQIARLSAAFVGILLISFSWFYLMVNHASVHLHVLPRHFLASFSVLAAMPVLMNVGLEEIGRPLSRRYFDRSLVALLFLAPFLSLLGPILCFVLRNKF